MRAFMQIIAIGMLAFVGYYVHQNYETISEAIEEMEDSDYDDDSGNDYAYDDYDNDSDW